MLDIKWIRDNPDVLDEALKKRAPQRADKVGVFVVSIDDVGRAAEIGRNIDETIRTVDALIFHEQHGEVCPANWEEGKEAMTATREGVSEYFSSN